MTAGAAGAGLHAAFATPGTPSGTPQSHVGFTLRVCAFTQPIKDGFSVDGAPLGNLSMAPAAEPALPDTTVVETSLRFEFAETGGWRVVKDDEKAARRSEREPGHSWHLATSAPGSSLRASQAMSDVSVDLDATVAQSRVMARKCGVSATAR